MELEEITHLLTLVAALDPYGQRTATRAEAQAWKLVIDHDGVQINPRQAQAAVARFHAGSPQRPMAAGDFVRCAREVIAEERLAERRAEAQNRRARHALPPGDRPEPTGVRDRSADLKALVKELMGRYRNWDVVGDPKTRESQASRHPGLAEKHSKARHARAQQIARERTAERARRVAAGLDPIGVGDE